MLPLVASWREEKEKKKKKKKKKKKMKKKKKKKKKKKEKEKEKAKQQDLERGGARAAPRRSTTSQQGAPPAPR